MPYVLITCLDSCLEPARLIDSSEPLRAIKEKCTIVGESLLVSTRRLMAADCTRRIFFGFDEIWFVGRRTVEPKPADLILVGPHRVTETDIIRHHDWLKQNRCALGLGDGTGLNFCIKAKGATKLFLEEVLKESVHA